MHAGGFHTNYSSASWHQQIIIDMLQLPNVLCIHIFAKPVTLLLSQSSGNHIY